MRAHLLAALTFAFTWTTEPQILPLTHVPEAGAWVKSEEANEVQLYDLKVNCLGQRLYGLNFGDPEFTGSGGSRVVFFVIQNERLRPLFDEVLMDWWGAQGVGNCPPIKVRSRRIGASGAMETKMDRLVFYEDEYKIERSARR